MTNLLLTRNNRFKPCSRRRQSGAALLIFLLLIIVGTSFVLLSGLNEKRIDQLKLRKTQEVLAQAREALIAYAVTNYERNPGEFGFLPCPDANGAIGQEGNQDPNCDSTNVNSIGRFPWSTLELTPLTDGDGECLWYAVSGQYKANPTTGMLNTDSRGYFQILDDDGTTLLAGDTPETRPVAVIIAPGANMPGQDRSEVAPAGTETVTHCGGNYDPANYLETLSGINNAGMVGTADNTDQFITTTVTNNNQNTFNDVITYVTMDDIVTAIEKRTDLDDKLYDNTVANNLTGKITECLADYSNRNAINDGTDDGTADDGVSMMLDNNPDGLMNQSLPWPAPIDLVDYRDDTQYDDRGPTDPSLFGRLPIIIDNSNDAIYNDCYGSIHDIYGVALPFNSCTRPVDNLLDYCEAYWNGVGADGTELKTLWQNWKDHLFYAVSKQYQPKPLAVDTRLCNNGKFCVTTDNPWSGGSRDWAAIVFFANSVIGAQSRNAPPLDAEEKNVLTNYLDDTLNPYTYLDDGDPDDAGDADGNTNYYDPQAISATFNDILYCMNDNDTDIYPSFGVGICVP